MSKFIPGTDEKSIQVYEDSVSGIDHSARHELGYIASHIIDSDPKLLLFILARYKFARKMLEDKKSILEIGCQEGFGALLFRDLDITYTGLDFYKPHIESARQAYRQQSNFSFIHHDITLGCHSTQKYDAIFSLDVLEHISKDQEHLFFTSAVEYLSDSHGPLIIGMPSLESQVYASERSKIGHVNCKTKNELRTLSLKYFNHVFMFSMNDEIVHTGFDSMSHYIFALCVSPKM